MFREQTCGAASKEASKLEIKRCGADVPLSSNLCAIMSTSKISISTNCSSTRLHFPVIFLMVHDDTARYSSMHSTERMNRYHMNHRQLKVC